MPLRKSKKRKPAVPAAGEKQSRQGVLLSGGFLVTALSLFAAVFFFAWGKYLEFKQPDPYDGGSYVYSAQHLLSGARLGIEEMPAAQPGTLLVNIIGVYCAGFRETGPEILQMLLQIGALAAMWAAAGRLFGRAAAVFSATTAAIYLSAPHIAKFGNTKEQYMIAFMVMAASFWILYESSGKVRWLFLTGVGLIWPYYFKATGLTIDIAFGIYFIARGILCRISGRQFQKELLWIMAGAWLGLAPLAAFFLWQDQWKMLWDSFPVLVLRILLFLDLLAVAVIYLARRSPVLQAGRRLRQVRSAIWITGFVAVLAMTAVGALIVHGAAGRAEGDVQSYLCGLFFIKIPQDIVLNIAYYWNRVFRAAGTESAYIANSRQMFSLSRQAPIVLRYYASLSLPVAASLLSIICAAGAWALAKLRKRGSAELPERLVWLLAMWWILDMGFAWISPHSYEQYYLPLCASGAMLGGYAVWRFARLMSSSPRRVLYYPFAAAAVLVMVGMIWPLVFGYKKSAYSGKPYGTDRNGRPIRQRGYVQSFAQARAGEGAWQKIGTYIREHTQQTDTIYVWGWYPGIYVQAQRLAPVPKAFESEMHTRPPEEMAGQVRRMLRQFEQTPPAYFVDTRKQHFPFDRPPLELWPVLQTRQGVGYLPNTAETISLYEDSYRSLLEKQYGASEAGRFDAIKPLRDFIMAHYRIVPELSSPGPRRHTLLKRKD